MFWIYFIVHASLLFLLVSSISDCDMSRFRFDGKGGIEQFRKWPATNKIIKTILIIVLWIVAAWFMHFSP